MISLTTVANLRADYLTNFSPYGSKVRAFANAEVHRDLLRIVRSSNRDCTSVARWLIDEAIGSDLLNELRPGDAVKGHKPGGTAVVLRLPPRIYHGYKRRARDLGCFHNSVSHYLGLALGLGLKTRSVEEWIEFFANAEDMVELIWRAMIAHSPPSLPLHSMCTT